MKKLQIMLLLMFLLILTAQNIGCKDIKESGKVSSQDTISIATKTVELQSDPIWEDSEVTSKQDSTTKTDTTNVIKKDDWLYGIADISEEESAQTAVSAGNSKLATRKNIITLSRGISGSNRTQSIGTEDLSAASVGALMMDSDNLGFSVGGAKDINNFRENIEQDYMPVVEDITYEGIFYDYYFDNNITEEATHLFEPAYTSYKNKHPLTDEEEIYLSVGLNSNLTQSSFKRKKLNLTIVLDISGSMSSSFNDYYYDRGLKQRNNNEEEEIDTRSKMEIAKECIVDLTKHLEAGDRFAVVLFDNSSYIAKPFSLVGNTDMDAIRKHISDISPRGGTNMYAGINSASELYTKLPDYDAKEYDNRVIFLTDAMPNRDVTNENSLWGVMKVNAEKKIYTTFVGVGVDLNSELINYITKTPGANYYSVHNAKDFKKRMDTQFDYMVTPLVFDLTLHLDSKNYIIDEVYGSPEADQATGEIMKVNTLFPSETEDGRTKGGIILIKLKQIKKASDDIKLTCSYKDRNGVPYLNSQEIEFSKSMRGTDNGIRKAVLLSRYVSLVHNWIENKASITDNPGEDDWQFNKQEPKHTSYPRPGWERGSSELTVNKYYKEQFSKFKNHFAKEATSIKDKDLRQELDILEKLVNGANSIKIMPYNFFNNWYQVGNKNNLIFEITEKKFQEDGSSWSYADCSYDYNTRIYRVLLSKSNHEKTLYFKLGDTNLYYSTDNINFTRLTTNH